MDCPSILGKSPAFRDKLKFIAKASQCESTVLILGETGTGKDVMARSIHATGLRKNRDFLGINCSDIPSDLFEAELFGYARGSFTGAYNGKPGLFEVIPGGTAFLDEIGILSLPLQAKLLKVIEEKKIRRIGEISFRAIDVRFIFATNEDLAAGVRKGNFRQDLYFRISVLRFRVPPLRQRREDIPLLAEHFLNQQNLRCGTTKRFSPTAMDKLSAYDYPGNVRELENMVERAYVFSDSDLISEADFQMDTEELLLTKDLEAGPDRLRQVLESCRWNKTRAASEIGKSRRQFYRILEKYQMSDCIRKN